MSTLNFSVLFFSYCGIYKTNKDGEALKEALKKYKNLNRKYDVLVPLSGGVDSCFTLIQICENFPLKSLVFHNHHGWDDKTATANVEKLCKELDMDLIIWRNDLKFMRKLFKYFNESDEIDVGPVMLVTICCI